MSRYFIEVAYKGTDFKGFQIQPNAVTIQGEINKAIQTVLKTEIITSPSSRTDAGVHALQNFLHFDTDIVLPHSFIYNINSILSKDIVIKNVTKVNENAHARFDATARKYAYHIIQNKNPFKKETAYFIPFTLDIDAMNEAASLLKKFTDFESFSKKNTDVLTYNCQLSISYFEKKEDEIIYHVQSNRFLRGMVRALVGTIILIGRKKITMDDLVEIVESKDCRKADFSTPAHGLFLENVLYDENIFNLNIEEKRQII